MELRLVRALVGKNKMRGSRTRGNSRKRRLGNAFWFEFSGFTGTRMNTRKSLFDPDFIINILFYPQSAFYPWSAVCSLHFTLSLHFTPGLQSAVCVLH